MGSGRDDATIVGLNDTSYGDSGEVSSPKTGFGRNDALIGDLNLLFHIYNSTD